MRERRCSEGGEGSESVGEFAVLKILHNDAWGWVSMTISCAVGHISRSRAADALLITVNAQAILYKIGSRFEAFLQASARPHRPAAPARGRLRSHELASARADGGLRVVCCWRQWTPERPRAHLHASVCDTSASAPSTGSSLRPLCLSQSCRPKKDRTASAAGKPWAQSGCRQPPACRQRAVSAWQPTPTVHEACGVGTRCVGRARVLLHLLTLSQRSKMARVDTHDGATMPQQHVGVVWT